MATQRKPKLSHIDAAGRPRMVDVSAKADTAREAVAKGSVYMSAETLRLIVPGGAAKGDVLTTAQLAGVMAAKRTPDPIPLCHPLMLTGIDVSLEPDPKRSAIDITATVRTTGKTGVEMEALTAVSVAALTVYDMAKAVQKDMRIGDIRLVRKRGGKSGDIDQEQGLQSAVGGFGAAQYVRDHDGLFVVNDIALYPDGPDTDPVASLPVSDLRTPAGLFETSARMCALIVATSRLGRRLSSRALLDISTAYATKPTSAVLFSSSEELLCGDSAVLVVFGHRLVCQPQLAVSRISNIRSAQRTLLRVGSVRAWRPPLLPRGTGHPQA